MRREAEAMEMAIQLSQDGSIFIASSSAIEDEVDRNSNSYARESIQELLRGISAPINESSDVRERFQFWEAQGIMTYDAYHLAFAECGIAEYFCTCDDRFRKKAQQLVTPPPRVIGLMELIQELSS